jgi:hypothetical protein
MTGATWTADEIQRLKAAVALYGPPTNAKQWRTIADAVGTRNGRMVFWVTAHSPK